MPLLCEALVFSDELRCRCLCLFMRCFTRSEGRLPLCADSRCQISGKTLQPRFEVLVGVESRYRIPAALPRFDGGNHLIAIRGSFVGHRFLKDDARFDAPLEGSVRVHAIRDGLKRRLEVDEVVVVRIPRLACNRFDVLVRAGLLGHRNVAGLDGKARVLLLFG